MAGSQYLERWLVEQLMFGSGPVRRFTQDSPVLPDVWVEYATDPALKSEPVTRPPRDLKAREDPHPPVNLLLTPFREVATGAVRRQVRERVAAEREHPQSKKFHDQHGSPRVVYNQTTVMATLYFEDLVRAVIPMTDWWARLLKRFDVTLIRASRDYLAEAVKDPEHPLPFRKGPPLPPDVLWMIRIVGAIAIIHRGEEKLPEVFVDRKRGPAFAETKDWMKLVDAVADLLEGVKPLGEPTVRIYSVALNRIARPTISGSVLAVKADAGRRLFDISCRSIRWAVIDSGVDATQPAFRKAAKDDRTKREKDTKKKDEKSAPNPRMDVGGIPFDGYDSRIRATYDFSHIEELLDGDSTILTQHLEKIAGTDEEKKEKFRDQIANINDALNAGRSIDWGVIEPLVRIPHDPSYAKHIPPPKLDHGTHVAGILGANWKKEDSKLEEDLIGVCPDIEMYDIRILDDKGHGDEFTVMAALQFVRWLNSNNDYMAVHGVNMSLSIPHDVANYACGRTPVCEEAERVVASGVVVVVAAGNQGYRTYTTGDGIATNAYNTISITDPGNADQVITVGATHRVRPHTYGVSYFSSRGPTGDGRLKPDLVAPGEKITAPLPDGTYGLKDGTSMAAPHVSGAAALLMARHNELVGRPGRIKQVLCDTATNLGRERYFQGAGMLDILRALQSV